jgi:thiosulfate/3-mercaptopyruvate sulfurtransferase
MKKILKLVVLSLAAFLVFAGMAPRLFADKDVIGNDPWSPGDLIQPEELARILTGQQKPVVLQIGIIHLYKMGHIPGSKYVGPANTAEGLDALKKQAEGLDRNKEVVCYCGCCPWANCPNTRPAYQTLRELGFKKIKMLYLPNSFGQDWSSKGYPVEKSS